MAGYSKSGAFSSHCHWYGRLVSIQRMGYVPHNSWSLSCTARGVRAIPAAASTARKVVVSVRLGARGMFESSRLLMSTGYLPLAARNLLSFPRVIPSSRDARLSFPPERWSAA